MADNIILNENTTVGQTVATKEFNSAQHELVMMEYSDVSGNPVEVSAANPLPVTGTVTTGGLTDTQLRATPVPISGTVTATTGGLTDTQLRATPVPISGTITAVTAITNALPAGTNAIGKLAANSGVIIGAVEIAAAQTLATVTAVTAITNALPAGTNLLGIVQCKDIPDATATYALTNVSSSAYEASHVLKASAGYLFMVTGYNSRTSSQFIQLHNSTTVPADTAVPVLIFNVPAASNFSLDLSKFGRYFSTGISICNSSTGPTKTVGSADCWFDTQII